MRKSIVKSGHDFVDATTAEMLWHVQICDLIEGLQSNLDSNEFQKISICDLSSYIQVYLPIKG